MIMSIRGNGRFRRLALCLFGAAALSALLAPRPAIAGPDDAPPGSVADPQLADIRAETAMLIGAPRTITLTSEKARAAQAAILRGDHDEAERILTDVLAHSRMQPWSFYPFNIFMGNLLVIDNDTFRNRLDRWVSDKPDDAIPLLVRALYYNDTGWSLRGSRFDRELTSEQRSGFNDNLAKASADIDASIDLRDDISYSHLLRLLVLTGNGNSPELEVGFQEAIARFPDYYPLYRERLRMLTPKWGGSVHEMYEFVDQYAGKAAAASPLRMLYISLYAQLLDAANIACWEYRELDEKKRSCVTFTMQGMATPQLQENVLATLKLYDTLDKYQFSVELSRYLEDVVFIAGGDAPAGALLQWAADAMRSDTRIDRGKSANNSMMLDEVTGDVWDLRKAYENAEAKFQHALQDMAGTSFPDEEAHDLALAGIYNKLARVSYDSSQFAKVISYTDAAIAYGGYNFSGLRYYKCVAYYRLKLFAAGVEACTDLIAHGGNAVEHYWRGQLYLAQHKTDDAITDYTAAAGSALPWGAAATINMSVIYFDRKDYAAGLRVLNKYPSLFDERNLRDDDRERRDTLAIAHNNRCFAYMNLGELQKALDDCTASLRFGSIPEAFRKQQELEKLLKNKTPSGADGPT